MAVKWRSTGYKGIRYREHPTRKVGVKRDRYYVIYQYMDGGRKEEALGWQSEGWTLERAINELSKLREARRLGAGPHTLEEKREIERGKVQEKRRAAITFDETFEKHYGPVAQSTKKANSWRSEKLLYDNWIKEEIGDLPLKDIKPRDLDRILKKMADANKSAATQRYALATIRQTFNYAYDNDLYSGENPVRKVRKPQADNRRVRFLTVTEADALLRALKEKSVDVHDMALLSLHSGVRFSEIVDLTWGDVDLKQRMLFIKDTKTSMNRYVPMTEEVCSMLKGRTHGGGNDLVFEGRGGEPIKAVSKSFDRVVRALGLNRGVTDSRLKIVFHSLRHSAASWMVQNGVDLYMVGQVLGHKTPTMTARYSHMSQEAFTAAIGALERQIKEGRKKLRLVKKGDAAGGKL